MHRRDLFRLAAALAAAVALPRWSWAAILKQRNVFTLGVASGSPSPDGFVLWTRLLDGPAPGTVPADTPRVPLPGTLTVRWEIAEDEGFRRIVRAGAAQALALFGHAVHVEVAGLKPDRWYFYRFMHGDAVTPAARTRTAPALEAMPGRTRFAFASSQRWEQGHYAAYRHLLEEDLDLVLFLGDYIYEYAMPKRPPSYPLARVHTLPAAKTLDDFRDRYALYRTDEHLQAAHRLCPWLVTWNDHEVPDDYAGQEAAGFPDDFLKRRHAGYQAFYENMPLRASVLTAGFAGLGRREGVRIYDRHSWGRLLRFHLLDTCQYRHRQDCRESEFVPQRLDAERSLLGAEQERWIEQGLTEDAAVGTRWTVLAQQTLFSRRDCRRHPSERYHGLAWDDYPARRQRLLDAVRDTAPRNTVFLGGDIHQNYVCKVLADFSDAQSPVIGSEFCGTSISSVSGVPQSRARKIADDHPHILLARSDQRGYAVADVTPERWITTLRVVDDATRADSGVSTLARFAVEDRVPGPRPIA